MCGNYCDIQKKVRKFYTKHNPTTLLIAITSILPALCDISSHIDIIYRNLFKLHLYDSLDFSGKFY